MLTPYSGGCACSAIRYTGTAEPAFSWNCHCRDCQRASGSGQCPVLYVPKTALTLTGNVTYYSVKAESGNAVERGFCSTCGSPVCIRAALVPNLIGLWAGSLDEPDSFQPQIDVWTASAVAWDHMSRTLLTCAHAPTEEQMQELLAG